MDLKQSINQIKLCTVKIVFSVRWLNRGPDGRLFKVRTLGSGFLVNKEGCVITAFHVIKKGEKMLKEYREKADMAELYVGLIIPNIDENHRGLRIIMAGNAALTKFDLVDIDELNDLALLKLKQNPFDTKFGLNVELYPGRPMSILKGVPSLNPNRPMEGEMIGLSGFCLDSSVLITKSGHVASSWYSMTKEVQKRGLSIPERIDIYLIGCQAPPGNSGGPVYLAENASIIGMLSASLPSPIWNDMGQQQDLYSDAGLGVVIPAHKIIELLQKNKLSYREFSEH